MADLKELILDKQQQLQAAEAEVLRLRRELQEARQILMGVANISDLPKPALPLSSPEMAERVIREAGNAIHVNEILSAIERKFQVRVPYATLVSNLARLTKAKKTFERTAPNTFGLIEWHEIREAEALFRDEMVEQEGPSDRKEWH